MWACKSDVVLIVLRCGSSFGDCRCLLGCLQSSGSENGGFEQALRIRNVFFIDCVVCPKGLRRVLAAAGALFSLWQPVAKNVDFWLHFGEI